MGVDKGDLRATGIQLLGIRILSLYDEPTGCLNYKRVWNYKNWLIIYNIYELKEVYISFSLVSYFLSFIREK